MNKGGRNPSSNEGALYEKIYTVVRQIPEGRVSAYGHIADMIDGCTARMVGYAMSALKSDGDVPWHRVINSQGKISPRSGGYGGELQRQMLEEEGVHFDAQGRVDFNRFGWPNPRREFNYTMDDILKG